MFVDDDIYIDGWMCGGVAVSNVEVIYMFVHTHTYMFVHIYIYIYVQTYIYMHIDVYTVKHLYPTTSTDRPLP